MILNENEVLCEDVGIANMLSSVMATAKSVFSANPEVAQKEAEKEKAIQAANIKKLKQDTGFDITSTLENVAKDIREVIDGVSENKSVAFASDIIHKAFFKTFTDTITAVEKATSKEIGVGLLVFILMLTLNSIAATILSVIAGPKLGMILTAVLVAPVTEESSRMLSMMAGGMGAASIFNATINTFEAVTYVKTILSRGGKFVGAVVVRLLAAMMHQFNLTVQVRGRATDLLTGSKKNTQNSLLIAVVIHALWNLASVIFNKQISNLIGVKTEAAFDPALDNDLNLNLLS